GVLSVDLCVDLGLAPAEFTPETTAVLRGALPDFAAAANPVDLTAQMLTDPGMLARVLPALEADPGVDAIVFQIALLGAATDLGRLVGDVARVAASTEKIVAVSCPQRPVVEAFRAGGVLAFDDASVALRSLACLAQATARRARWLDRATLEAPPPSPAPAVPAGRPGEPFLNEWESQRLLAPFGLPLVDTVFVTAARAAPDAAEQLGYPVVVKACAAALPHKSDVGGVALGLSDRAAVAEACRRIEANVRAAAPGVALDGFLIQRQARGALELALGVKVDPVFGPVVLLGSGGVLIEVLRDFRLLLPPIDAAAAEEALRGLRIGPLWDGVRGGAPLDLPAAVELLQHLGEAARGLGTVISEIDLNPVLVGRRGEGVTVLDALVRR
ncbi:MAG TPA: acetate--CoA ligase family protein, partial [Candidatus Udaeobacter sp.]|nr:acetate--CoA ligase family protein [Candidatus Udaeobacter sp.]